MHGRRTHLESFVRAFEAGHQFPSLLGLVIEYVFHGRRPGIAMGAEVDHFVAQGGNQRGLLSMDVHAVRRVRIGPAVDDRDPHLGIQWQGAIGRKAFMP
jgi:hypothetical protein